MQHSFQNGGSTMHHIGSSSCQINLGVMANNKQKNYFTTINHMSNTHVSYRQNSTSGHIIQKDKSIYFILQCKKN